MKCPTCKDITLVMTSRQDIEIDYCPECRGVWLDRGELDKLIEKSVASSSAQNTPPPQPQPSHSQPQYPQQDYYKKSKDSYHYKRKKSFLEEIFD